VRLRFEGALDLRPEDAGKVVECEFHFVTFVYTSSSTEKLSIANV
jgi:hypothetical protein